jgi:hypothetical protein
MARIGRRQPDVNLFHAEVLSAWDEAAQVWKHHHDVIRGGAARPPDVADSVFGSKGGHPYADAASGHSGRERQLLGRA